MIDIYKIARQGCRGIVVPEADREDCIQCAALAVSKALGQVDHPQTSGSFLRRVARNAGIACARRLESAASRGTGQRKARMEGRPKEIRPARADGRWGPREEETTWTPDLHDVETAAVDETTPEMALCASETAGALFAFLAEGEKRLSRQERALTRWRFGFTDSAPELDHLAAGSRASIGNRARRKLLGVAKEMHLDFIDADLLRSAFSGG